ncbi:MAG: hypothetical protein ACP5OA_06995 [Candidatus Woesearchaeota archaeon]
MKSIDLKGKSIRLYYHCDMDGTIAAALIKLFSDAKIVEYIPCPYQNFQKLEEKKGILDVFVDCRAKDRNEDIRIDHHGSGEKADYLQKENIIVDTRFDSAVRLVALVLNINSKMTIDENILRQMDKVDSGRITIFADYKLKSDTFINVLNNIAPKHFVDWEIFKEFILEYMEAGIHKENVEDKNSREQILQEKYGLEIDDIKKTPHSPLTKIFYTPANDGHIFFHKLFKMEGSEFFRDINDYIKREYNENAGKKGIAVYVIVGFLSKTGRDGKENPEPYEIFVSRGPYNTDINIGQLILQAKALTKITNGGGRSDVGGMNAANKESAIKALQYIYDAIKRNCR